MKRVINLIHPERKPDKAGNKISLLYLNYFQQRHEYYLRHFI